MLNPFIAALAAVALVFGGYGYLRDWRKYPKRNLLILACVWAGLSLWLMFSWWRYDCSLLSRMSVALKRTPESGMKCSRSPGIFVPAQYQRELFLRVD